MDGVVVGDTLADAPGDSVAVALAVGDGDTEAVALADALAETLPADGDAAAGVALADTCSIRARPRRARPQGWTQGRRSRESRAPAR